MTSTTLFGALASLHGGGLQGADLALRHLREACHRLQAGEVSAYALAETPEEKAKGAHRHLWAMVQDLRWSRT